MKKVYWIMLYLILLAGELVAIVLHNETIQFICKPLLIIVLLLYFIDQTRRWPGGLKTWIQFALFFSWTGDVLLIFQDKRPVFFLLGLSAFLLAHIFYIIYFHAIRVSEKINSNPWLLFAVVAYYAVLISILSPYLGSMKLPVRIYGIFISFMFMLALHMWFIKNRGAALQMIAGATLFVLSDSLLAINKFYYSFELAGILIMVTYGLAQLFITEGAIRYIRSANSR